VNLPSSLPLQNKILHNIIITITVTITLAIAIAITITVTITIADLRAVCVRDPFFQSTPLDGHDTMNQMERMQQK
jgi:hypothetical protein